MFALAKLYFICPLSAVVKTDHGTVCAKFRDGSYYDVDIVTTHESFDVLEELKESLCSHAPRIVLSRCDVNSPIENEQKELEIDTFPRIPKQEVFEEEFCIKEEPPLHFPNLDTFLEDDSVNEEASEGNLFGGCPSLNILAEQEVVVNDVFFQNACREVLHDHSYSVKSGENEEIPSKISSLNECLHKFEILDEEQESIKDAQNVSDRFPVYTLPNNSQVDMDCHFNFPDSSVSDKFSVDGAIPDLSNIKQEEIVVNCDFFESSNEFILPKYGSEADLHCSFLEPQEGPIVNVQCSNELTSGTETAEGDQEVENIMVSSGKRTKQYFCVYCKKLYTALPRHLERLHRSEEAVKQFCDLPKDAKITEAMNTRSKRTLALDTSGDRNLLDLPKHRSSKAAITGEQTNVFINVKLKQETQADKNHHQEKHADDREHIGHDPRFDQGGSSNLFQSSKSKCTIDSSDCEPDDQVKEDPLTPILNHDELNCNIAKNSSLVLASISKKYSGPTIEGDKLPPRSDVDEVVESLSKFLQPSPSVGNIGSWTKKSSCPYCLQSITHFPRHLQRHHQDKGAVKEFLSVPVRDPKRKELLNAIRRKAISF